MRIICTKCREEMTKVILDRYEYVKNFPLFRIPAYQCRNCGNLFFTERMIEEMEKRTEELKIHSFGFSRTIATSGKGLVVRVPSDLASHLRLKEGEKVRILPVNHRGFLVEREE
ncbi:MAG: hypothetical protein HYW25_02205 [Candidatus Aenigmarchaeota archaeon]|nr:hypothetical protein [Candidatus Aenigmarchaeota archaeon]